MGRSRSQRASSNHEDEHCAPTEWTEGGELDPVDLEDAHEMIQDRAVLHARREDWPRWEVNMEALVAAMADVRASTRRPSFEWRLGGAAEYLHELEARPSPWSFSEQAVVEDLTADIARSTAALLDSDEA